MFVLVQMAIKIDDLLVQRVKNKDERAFEEMVAIFKLPILNICRKFIYDEGFVEEVAWQVFFVVWQKAGTFKGQSAFSSWVYRIAANQCLMYLRRDRFSARRFLGDLEEEQRILDGRFATCPDELLAAKEVILGVKRALKKKSMPPFRRALIKHMLSGQSKALTDVQIAKELKASIPRIKSAIHRNRLGIAKQLAANE